MKIITAYRCDYCKKIYLTEKGVVRHEATRCFISPLVKNCRTCKYNFYDKTYNDDHEPSGWYCKKKDQSIEYEEMPETCEQHEIEFKKNRNNNRQEF